MSRTSESVILRWSWTDGILNAVAQEPVIYRQEVLTIMGLIGDLTFAVQRLLQLAEGEDGEEEEADED